jgi:hypothetical protein
MLKRPTQKQLTIGPRLFILIAVLMLKIKRAGVPHEDREVLKTESCLWLLFIGSVPGKDDPDKEIESPVL